MRARLFATLALLGALVAVSLSPAPDAARAEPNIRKPLDQRVYETWNAVKGQTLSPDGAWALYSLTRQVGDGSIHIARLDGDASYTFERGVDGAFSHDSSHAVFRIKAPLADTRAAKRAKKKKNDMPKDALGILDLASGELTTIARARSFAMPEKAGGWLAVQLEKPKKNTKKNNADAPEEQAEATPAEPNPEPTPEAPARDNKNKKGKKEGTPLVLVDLSTGAQRTFEHVAEYAFDEGAHFLAFTVSTKAGAGDGVFVVNLEDTDEPLGVMTGAGEYTSLAFDKAGDRLAFLSDRDDYEADEPAWTLHLWTAGEDSSDTLAAEGDPGLPDGWWVSAHRAPTFSESGDRVFFGSAPRPEPGPDPDDPDTPLPDERPKLDIWHWNEPDLHTIQLHDLEKEKKRSYLAVADLTRGGRLTQLADESWRDAEVGAKGDADVALALYDEPYRKMIQWDIQRLRDLALVDVRTGEREVILKAVKAQPTRGSWLSPDAGYVLYWDYPAQAWMAYDVNARERVNLSAHIPHPVFDERHDTPALAGPYGVAGWLKHDAGALIYDRFDVWLVDPDRPDEPRCLTEETGRRDQVRFRLIDLDPEEDAIDPRAPLLLSAFDVRNKNAGFFRDRVRGSRRPERLLMAARRFSTPTKAEDADTLLLTRESFREFPDLWTTGPDFASMRQISHANPQQADYLWGDVRLVDWTSARGDPLRGLLYTPPGFDRAKKYPMLVYFYERNSDNLHAYSPPTPHRSIIRFSFYASRGYLIFVPDIIYQNGHPGRSAVECVLPGVTSLIDKGFVDAEHIGVQGHSWGGYQSAYLITQTDLFAAAGSGAPVSDMFSAYGGIRWGSGMSRQFQYEQTQSRIGGTIWEKPLLYFENSPIFHLEGVTTPLLILHNDGDTAVPWQQGVELFVGLRRLGKPVWLLNYNGQPHWPLTYPDRRDYAIRMQQFFDHYLKGAPTPVWMRTGVPAVEKDRELGLEPADPR